MTKLQKINRFLEHISEREAKEILRGLLNDTLVVSDVIEEQVNVE